MIRTARYTELLDEKSLLVEYAAECSIPELGPFNPQPAIYEAMDKSGMMECFAAFHVEQIVGFAVLLTTILPHYGRKAGTVESLFVSVASRPLGTGLQLLAAVEEYARDAGCIVIFYIAPTGSQLERLLMARKAYRRTNGVFMRVL